MFTPPLFVVHEVLAAVTPVTFGEVLVLPTLALAVAEQPLAPVTVTVYVPAGTLAMSSVVAEFDQTILKGLVPPVIVKFTAPLPRPQVAVVGVVLNEGAVALLAT